MPEGRTTVIVAVIGAIGVLGAAYLSRTDRPPPVIPPPVVENATTPDPGPAPTQPPADPPAADAVMSGRMEGVNLDGQDFNEIGVPSENAATCAEMCRTNAQCDSETYVISQKRCWMKRGVPPKVQGGSDYVSAIKLNP